MLQEIGYLVLSNHNNEKDENHSSQILDFDKGNSVFDVFGIWGHLLGGKNIWSCTKLVMVFSESVILVGCT